MSPGPSSQKLSFYLQVGRLSAKKDGLLSPSGHKDERNVKTVDTTQFNDATSNIPSISFGHLFRFATRSELILDCIGLFAAACSGAAQPLMTLFFGNLVQSFIDFEIVALKANYGSSLARAQIPAAAAHFRQVAAKDALYLVYMGIFLFCCISVGMGVWMYNGELYAKRLRENYLRAVLHQDVAFFDCVGAGEITSRIHNDARLVQQGMSQKVPLVANKLFAFITGFALAYFRNWRLALAVSSILPVMATMGAVTNTFTSKCTKSYLQHISKSVTLAVEAISTIRTAQAFGIQSSLADIYDIHIDRSKKIDTRSAVLQGISGAVLYFVLYAAYGLVFSFGATLINEGHASVGSVVTVILSIFIGSSNLIFLAPDLQVISHGCGAAANLFHTIDRVPNIDSADPGGFRPEKIEGHITFENVNFSYPSRPSIPVIKNLSFTLPAGETAAFVGASGSGKSTIISLVERFYDPLSGVIKLDGVDIKNLNTKWLRTKIGLVSQEPTLFATTIQENIAQGLIGTKFEGVPEEKKIALVKDACIKANADCFISNLPLGYNTMVGESGFLTSGGQRQRIAIARAIVGDPKILLLDEATSALDTQSESIVQDALNRAAAGRTTVIIAHRLSTIKDADRIFVIGDGLVLEHGTHSQLLGNPDGPYSRLVTAQNLRNQSEVTTKKSENASAVSGEAEDMQTVAGDIVCRNTTHTLAKDGEHRKEYDHQTTPEYDLLYMVKRIGGLNLAGWLNYGCGIIAAFLNGMVFSAFAIVYSKGIRALSSVDPHQRRHDGDRVALWFFLIAIASIILSTVQNYMFASNAATITARIRSISFRAILRQDIEFFDQKSNTTGSLASSLIRSPEGVKGMAGISLGAILQSIATLVSATVLGLAFSWRLGLVALACLPILVFTGYTGVRVVLWREKRTATAHESSAHIACETAGAIRTVASLTRENDCLRLYSQSLEASLQRAKRSALWSSMLFAASQATTFFVAALVFWYGSRLVSTFAISELAFFMVLLGTTYAFSRASSTFAFAHSLSLLKSACSSVINLVDAKPKINADLSQGASITETFRGQIQFRNVHFHYPRRPNVCVLRGLSFKAEPGTYIALVGASGSGKSTVIQLIERFYNPSAGHIYLDGKAISELNLQNYRQQIALVSQEPTLYSGTIRFNILLGAIKPQAEVTQEEIERVCHDANILDFINSLPKFVSAIGFDTDVGNKGSQLSGGQKQRIAIARALIRNPKILLLDEATSALDSSSERVVQDALDHAAQGRTTIVIAHRLSTVQNADCIYFIKNGMVSESGTHDELLQKRGDYFDYVHLQVLSKN